MVDEVNCKKCDSVISKNANYCHHCKSPQNTKSAIKQYIPLLVIFSLIFFSIKLSTSGSHENNYTPPPKFNEHSKEITVKSSDLSFTECGECKSKFNAVAIGIIQNNTEFSWEDFKIEVRLYNKDGVMIDTISESSYGLAVQPKSEVSFRVMQRAAKPVEEYVSHKVFINAASHVSDSY